LIRITPLTGGLRRVEAGAQKQNRENAAVEGMLIGGPGGEKIWKSSGAVNPAAKKGGPV